MPQPEAPLDTPEPVYANKAVAQAKPSEKVPETSSEEQLSFVSIANEEAVIQTEPVAESGSYAESDEMEVVETEPSPTITRVETVPTKFEENHDEIQEEILPAELEVAAEAPNQEVSEIAPAIPVLEGQVELPLDLAPEATELSETEEMEYVVDATETPPLPNLLEELVTVAVEPDHEPEHLDTQLEMLVENLNVEASTEEVRETIEVFTKSVSKIKETIEAIEQVTEVQIEELVTAAIELLEILSIDPQRENIKRIITLALGEEFVLAHHAFILDRLVDELGTHERKTWLTRSMGVDQTPDHPTLLGRIALQLGLSLKAA